MFQAGFWSDYSEKSIQSAVVALALLLVLTPLVPLLLQSLIDRPLYESGWQLSLGGYRELVTSPEVAGVLWNTVYFAVLATVLSLIIGVGLAILVGRTNVPLAGTVAAVSLWPFYISPIVLAVGWSIVYGPSGYMTLWIKQHVPDFSWNLYSLEGMAIVSGISHAPVTFLYAIASVRQQDSSLESAALVAGAGPWRILTNITLPLMKPALIFCVIMNVVASLEAFAIPLVLGGHVGIELITSFIYYKGFEAVVPDYPLVAAASVCLLAIISILTSAQLLLLRKSFRYVTVTGKVQRQQRFDLGRARWAVLGMLGVYLLAAVALPVVGIIARSVTSFLSPMVPISATLTTANYETIFSETSYVNAMRNTIVIALFGGLISTIVMAAIALVAHRSNFRFRRALDFLAQYPRAIPGILIGLGLFYVAALLPFFSEIRNTIWILVIAYTMRFLPSGYSAIAPAVMQLSNDFDRAARTMGIGWTTICLRIVGPLIKGALFSCYAIVVVLSIKEYAAAVFLYMPGTEVIGTVMLSFWAQGDSGPIAALAVFQIASVAIFVLVFGKLFRVRFHG